MVDSTHRCDARDQDWVLAGSTDRPLCSAPAVAIAIFQLVAGRSSNDAKMHYRSTRRRVSWWTRRGIIWMNVAQMNGASAAAATHDNSNDFCCCCSRRRHHRRRSVLSSCCCWIFFVFLVAACTDYTSRDCLGRAILHLIFALLEIYQLGFSSFSLYSILVNMTQHDT